MLKKIAKIRKKIAPALPPLNKLFSFGTPKGKKLPFGNQGKKSFRGPKKGSSYFLWSPKGSFLSFEPPKDVLFLWGTKGKTFSGGGGGFGNWGGGGQISFLEIIFDM